MTQSEYDLASKLIPAFEGATVDEETRAWLDELKVMVRKFEWEHWSEGCCA